MLEIAKINSTLLFYGSNIAIPRKTKNKNKKKRRRRRKKEKETKRKEGIYIRMVKKT